MNLMQYFDSVKGVGVLSTSDEKGKVNSAVFARPHFIDESTALFIMVCNLTLSNLQDNPWAAYLFIETAEGYNGKRLYLKKIKAEQNPELVKEICRRCNYSGYDVEKRFVVYFNVEKVLPLIGSNPGIEDKNGA